MLKTILIVDDEKHTREGLKDVFEGQFDVYLAKNPEDAFRLMDIETFNVILTDLKMGDQTGMSVIEKAIKLPNKPICIMITAYGNISLAVEAMKKGAYDFLTKPVDLDKLEFIIKRALKNQEKEIYFENEFQKNIKNKKSDLKNLENFQHLEQSKNSENLENYEKSYDNLISSENYKNLTIIGKSFALKDVLNKISIVSPTKSTVLLQGETGTGKELIAKLIHEKSKRSNYPFVAVHCAALSSTILESELFGHEKGSFTGAHERRLGRFEKADKGTLFLDEIGEIDEITQIKLLRFLETKTFERIGGNQQIHVDIRLVCATHRNLLQMVKDGKFREDLYYRLNVISVKIPSLRERTDDIPVLLDYYIKFFSKENNVRPIKFSDSVISILSKYSWPGNIRELKNFVENTVVMHRDEIFDVNNLDQKFYFSEEKTSQQNQVFSIEDQEKQLLRNALMKSKGNRTQAAELLGINRRTLHRKLKQWNDLLN